MPTLMIIGVLMFFAGVLGVMALLFANGGLDKARQFAVLEQLLTGKLGSGRRNFSLLALLLTFAGAMVAFAGVSRMDAKRAQACDNYCNAAGFIKGSIGPSQDRGKDRFVACICSAPGKESLEQRADLIRPQ